MNIHYNTISQTSYAVPACRDEHRSNGPSILPLWWVILILRHPELVSGSVKMLKQVQHDVYLHLSK